MWSIFCAIKRSWSQHFVEQFSAFLILTISYSALILVALALTNIQNVFEMWGQVNQMTVYLNNDVKPEAKTELMNALKVHPMVTAIREITPAESAKKFEEKFAQTTSQKIEANKVAQFFPGYFVINLDQQLAYKGASGVLDQFVAETKATFGSVKNISYGKSWLIRYVGVLSAIQWIGWFLIMVFLLASIIVSSSVIKTILYSRREEIEILEFVGADDFSIYLPQIVNTFLLGLVAFLMALGINLILFDQVKTAPDSLLSIATKGQLSFVSPWVLLGVAIFALISLSLYSLLTIFNLLPRRKKTLLLKGVIH